MWAATQKIGGKQFRAWRPHGLTRTVIRTGDGTPTSPTLKDPRDPSGLHHNLDSSAEALAGHHIGLVPASNLGGEITRRFGSLRHHRRRTNRSEVRRCLQRITENRTYNER